jgi:hypothetical protein
VESLKRAGRGQSYVLAEDDRAAGTGRRELDDAEVIPGRVVQVEPPTQLALEALGAINVRDRDDDHLELHFERARPKFSAANALCA